MTDLPIQGLYYFQFCVNFRGMEHNLIQPGQYYGFLLSTYVELKHTVEAVMSSL